jgi:hypothetical protein
MKAPALSIKLDRPRAIRFDMAAFLALDETCKFNVLAGGALSNLSPSRIRDLVWAGQLHTEKCLNREKVGRYLPTDMDKLTDIVTVVMQAINAAWTKDAPNETAKETPDDEPGETQG